MGALYSLSVNGNGSLWPVRFGRTVLGSADHCAIVLSHDGVSEAHCQILTRPRPGGVEHRGRIVDLGSTTGTFVNGLAIYGPHDLAHGDKIRVGSIELSFVAFPSPGR